MEAEQHNAMGPFTHAGVPAWVFLLRICCWVSPEPDERQQGKAILKPRQPAPNPEGIEIHGHEGIYTVDSYELNVHVDNRWARYSHI